MEVYYLWSFKPGETQADPPMENIIRNTMYFPSYRIIRGTPEHEIMPYVNQFNKLRQLWDKIPHWVVKADVARYLVIYFHGGFYFDVDCEIRSPIQLKADKRVAVFVEKVIRDLNRLGPRELKSEARKTRIANYAFGAKEKRDPFIRELIEESIQRISRFLAESPSRTTERDIVWLAGPDVVTSVYHRTSDKSRIQLFPESTLEHYEFGSWRDTNNHHKKNIRQ